MANEDLEIVNLGFTRDEEFSQKKMEAFERALDNSFGLYRTGLAQHGKIFEGVPNKRMKVSLATASSAANILLTTLEEHGGVIVMNKELSAGLLVPWLLAGSELLNTEK